MRERLRGVSVRAGVASGMRETIRTFNKYIVKVYKMPADLHDAAPVWCMCPEAHLSSLPY